MGTDVSDLFDNVIIMKHIIINDVPKIQYER